MAVKVLQAGKKLMEAAYSWSAINMHTYERSWRPIIVKACSMAFASYAEGDDRETLLKALKDQLKEWFPDDKMLDLKWFQMQIKGHWSKPAWFLASASDPEDPTGKSEAYFLSFRGSSSTWDWLRDFHIALEQHDDNQFHLGFLDACKDTTLKDCLGKYLAKHPERRLYVLGHSLGGAVAHTFVAGGFVQACCPSFDMGKVTCINFGGPRIGTFPNCDKLHLKKAKFITIVNNLDIVPRLLGTIAPNQKSAILKAVSALGIPMEAMRTLTSYEHVPGTTVGFIKNGHLFFVKPEDHGVLMNLDNCITKAGLKLPDLIGDHLGYKPQMETMAIKWAEEKSVPEHEKKPSKGKGQGKGRGKGPDKGKGKGV